MKIVILFAVTGLTASLYTSTSLLKLSSRTSQLPLLSSSSTTDSSPRYSRPEASSIQPRGLGSNLAACFGKLCGKKQTPDQSVRGPAITRLDPYTSSGGSAVQLGSPRSTDNRNILPNLAQLRSSPTNTRPSSPTRRLPLAPWEPPERRSGSPIINRGRSGSRGTFPMPVAIGWNASPSTWSQVYPRLDSFTGSTTSSSQGSPRSPR